MENATCSQTIYQRPPLDSSTRQIRLLQLHYSTNDDALVECSMTTVSLIACPKFNALSYVWGDGKNVAEIAVDGIRVAVTASLGQALRQTRSHMSSRTDMRFSSSWALPVWADAICINQEDDNEREEQVRLMGDIYSLAHRVLVWLGDGSDATDMTIDLMNSDEFLIGLRDRAMTSREPTEQEIMVDVVLKKDLCRRPWWRRLWIRQEFILASEQPTFLCGNKQLLWDRLLFTFLSVPRAWSYPQLQHLWVSWGSKINPTLLAADSEVGIHPESLDRCRDRFQRFKSLPLWYCIRYVVSRSAATNPRDFAFGILGLLGSSEKDAIPVNYGLDTMEIYQQVGKRLWTENPEFCLTDLLALFTFHAEPTGYPSWVPDLSQRQGRGWRDHRAILSKYPWRQPQSWLDHSSKTLHLSGIECGCISQVIGIAPDAEDIQEMTPFLREIETHFMSATRHPVPPDHPLHSAQQLRHLETIVETLSGSEVETDELFPGIDDESIWEILMGRRDIDPGMVGNGTTVDELKGQLFSRLFTRLKGKLLGRKVFVTDAGFLGVGVSHLNAGDFIVLPFGASGLVVLRSAGDTSSQSHEATHRMVGCAYLSGVSKFWVLDDLYDEGHFREAKSRVI